MAEEEKIALYNELINRGCCKRCILRYLGHCKTLLSFDHPNICLVNFGYLSPIEEFEEERQAKIAKPNPCSVCLGLLQDSGIEEVFTSQGVQNASDYESKTFIVYITFPTCILVRDHSMKVHLKQLFPNTFDSSKIIKVNHAWRYTIQNRLSKILKKTYSNLSKLTLHFYTKYELEDEEMDAVLHAVKKMGQSNLSKHCVGNMLETIPDTDFSKAITVPPSNPLYYITLTETKCYSEPIHITGNYCKYSRELSQVNTWCDDYNVFNEFSIESIVKDAVMEVTGEYNEMIFKATAHDEHNIRVLGDGRQFHLQICDPKFESLSQKKCQFIEYLINNSKAMSVRNLREATKRDIMILFEHEIQSARTYKILCMVYKCKNVDHCVNAVNMYTSFMVEQKVPIRVLHQRKDGKKERKVFNMKARKLKGNLIELDLCAQCGFSLPEFIHGDFGRTKPSLGDIMRAKVDILAIDIIDFKSTLTCAVEEEEVQI